MRILHFADVHIGVETYSRPDPESGLPSRLVDVLRAFDELVDYAIDDGVDLVVFAGDAYKSRDPSQTHQREFARRIMRLTAAGVPVFLLVGNHDLPYALGRATALDIYPTLGVPLVHVGARLGTYVVSVGAQHPSRASGHSAAPLQIIALPWVTRSHLLTFDEYKNLSAQALNEVMERKIEELLQHELARLDPEAPAILAGHVTVAAARTGSERSMMVGRDPVVLKSTLADPRLDYVALGHVHRMQVFEGPSRASGQVPTPVVYSGSLQRVDFGEEGEEKGFYVIDIDPAAPPGQRLRSYDFVPVKARAFVTIAVRALPSTGSGQGSGNPTEDVLRAIRRREKDIAEAIVRVQVKVASGDEALLDDAAVRRALSGAHYIAGIAREVEGAPRGRLGDVNVEELTPLDALKLYLESKETPPERARVLLEYGARLIGVLGSSESTLREPQDTAPTESATSVQGDA